MQPCVPRRVLLEFYQEALRAVEGERCVAAQLMAQPLGGRVWAVAIGKAAAAMLAGAFKALDEQLERALLITKHGHIQGRVFPRSEILEAAHPVPDASSLQAGSRLLEFLATAPMDIHWLFLISGGTSSLVEVLPEGVTLMDMQRVNQWLMASGLPIEQVNALRRRLSCIKGGRLLSHLRGRSARVLLISDVPGDDPATIGSGLLHATADAKSLPEYLPAWLIALINKAKTTSADLSAAHIDTSVVARVEQALDAAAAVAATGGYRVFRSRERLHGDAVVAGKQIAATLLEGAPGVYLWGGETTVCLPVHPGQGGRCQHLALVAARELAGRHGIHLLVASTDGTDGPGDVAGACVDGQTLERGSLDGLDADVAIEHADAGRFLEAAGDLLVSGPTGTNVTDLVIGLKTTDM